MDVKRFFRPGEEIPYTLEGVVRHWNATFGEEGRLKEKRDQVSLFVAKASFIHDVISRAVLSIDESGKMHNHQTRVPKRSKDEAILVLKKAFARYHGHPVFNSFDALYDFMARDLERVNGIGLVSRYDFAVRIGAKFDLAPTSLYLHAGVREGWMALHRMKSARGLPLRVPREELPVEFALLPTDEVEDLLCTYRSILPTVMMKGKTLNR